MSASQQIVTIPTHVLWWISFFGLRLSLLRILFGLLLWLVCFGHTIFATSWPAKSRPKLLSQRKARVTLKRRMKNLPIIGHQQLNDNHRWENLLDRYVIRWGRQVRNRTILLQAIFSRKKRHCCTAKPKNKDKTQWVRVVKMKWR